MPPAPPGDNEGAHGSAIDGVAAGYAYLHAPPPNTQFLNLDAYAKHSKHDKDCIPDLRTDQGTSPG